MNRRPAALICFYLFFAVAVSALSASCRDTPPPPRREIVVWQNVGSWSSRGSTQTEAFISNTGMLRVRWEARDESVRGRGILRVTVHSAVSGRPLVVAVDHMGVGQDTAYVNEDPREFYLVVDSSHLNWTVAVDEGIPATAAQPMRR